jgi:hypothetical protein
MHLPLFVAIETLLSISKGSWRSLRRHRTATRAAVTGVQEDFCEHVVEQRFRRHPAMMARRDDQLTAGSLPVRQSALT